MLSWSQCDQWCHTWSRSDDDKLFLNTVSQNQTSSSVSLHSHSQSLSKCFLALVKYVGSNEWTKQNLYSSHNDKLSWGGDGQCQLHSDHRTLVWIIVSHCLTVMLHTPGTQFYQTTQNYSDTWSPLVSGQLLIISGDTSLHLATPDDTISWCEVCEGGWFVLLTDFIMSWWL